jgi:hypothetical protein
MAYSQVSRVGMETFSQSNSIVINLGQDHMSKVIPVIKGDKRQTYEVQVENLGTKIMLKTNGNRVLQ